MVTTKLTLYNRFSGRFAYILQAIRSAILDRDCVGLRDVDLSALRSTARFALVLPPLRSRAKT